MSYAAESPLRPAAGQRRVAWVLFAPLLAMAGTHWVLSWLQDRSRGVPRLPLAPFAGAQDPAGGLGTLGCAVAALLIVAALARWAWRRWGARVALRTAGVAWVALSLLACGGLVGRYFDAQSARPLPEAVAEVLGSRLQPPTLHGPGGTLLVLRVPGMDAVQQVLIDDPAAAAWKPGQRLALQWAAGRYGRRFVTDWRALPATPGSPLTAASASASASAALLR